jgi:hypothetical protein
MILSVWNSLAVQINALLIILDVLLPSFLFCQYLLCILLSVCFFRRFGVVRRNERFDLLIDNSVLFFGGAVLFLFPFAKPVLKIVNNAGKVG